MSAMDKIRNLARRNFANYNNAMIAEKTGIGSASVSRFMRGLDGSLVIAQYMSDKYGGDCARYLNQHLTEMAHIRRSQVAHARKSVVSRARKDTIPEDYVRMATKTIETHHLIDPALLPDSLHGFVGYVELAA